MSVNLTRDETSNESRRVKLKRANYKLRVVEEPTFSYSKLKADGRGNNPMLTFKVEVASPAVQFANGKEETVAGEGLTVWATFFKKEGSDTESNPTLASIHEAGGLPLQFERDEDTGLPVDSEGTPFRYVGIEFDAQCGSDEYEQKDDDGKPLTNPKTGEVLKGFRNNVIRVY